MPKLAGVNHQRAIKALEKAGFLDYTTGQTCHNDQRGACYHHSTGASG